jgi:hypothetical protein
MRERFGESLSLLCRMSRLVSFPISWTGADDVGEEHLGDSSSTRYAAEDISTSCLYSPHQRRGALEGI